MLRSLPFLNQHFLRSLIFISLVIDSESKGAVIIKKTQVLQIICKELEISVLVLVNVIPAVSSCFSCLGHWPNDLILFYF